MYAILLFLALGQIQDGTVIFIQDGFFAKPIEAETGTPLNHCAIVLDYQGELYVYEATPPKVRKLPFLKWAAIENVELKLRPKQKLVFVNLNFNQTDLTKMKAYAESQLGRPYMLRGWWKEVEVKGTHCSQYVGNILESTGKIRSNNFKESPVSLYNKISHP